MPELPPKLFFRIGEVAGLVGVEPHVLRYWEREFRSIRPTKSAKGQRVYARKDVENLLRVRDLLYRDGFTIAGAKKQMQRGGLEPHELALPEPASGEEASGVTGLGERAQVAEPARPVSREDEARVREKLSALRLEVETFLSELSARTPDRDEP
jgi:DNA-binding transcriptional MerR regulator